MRRDTPADQRTHYFFAVAAIRPFHAFAGKPKEDLGRASGMTAFDGEWRMPDGRWAIVRHLDRSDLAPLADAIPDWAAGAGSAS